MPDVDKKKTEVYRHGLCGEACDVVLKTLNDKNVSTEFLRKVQPNPAHFYLEDQKSDLIIDPTYKHFFYRLLIDTNSGNTKENVTKEQIAKIDNMPSIFVGSLADMKSLIEQTLNIIKKSSELENTLEIWNIPFEKRLTEDEKQERYKENIQDVIKNKDSIFEKSSSDELSGDEKLAYELQAEELEKAGYEPPKLG
jgi:hypothetical protein